MAEIRNIGIFAHVDAGKTTLSERLLSHAGAIRQTGSVDAGTAHTDRLDIERRRGISVESTAVTLSWKGTAVHLIDTPGHVDFAAEVERSMWALDGAVLLLSAAEGVQPQTELLFSALREENIPMIAFINKIDRENADIPRTVAQMRSLLTDGACLCDTDAQKMECLAEHDERALSDWIDGILYAPDALSQKLARLVSRREALPVFTGSALRDIGIEALWDAIISLLPAPSGDATAPLCGVVFAIDTEDAIMGRCAHVRVYSGTLRNRDALSLPARSAFSEEKSVQRKVTQIRSLSAVGKREDMGILEAGDIGAVYGLGDVRVGNVLGDAALLPKKVVSGAYSSPLLMVKVSPKDEAQRTSLQKALMELRDGDPLLDVHFSSDGKDMQCRIMGAIQLEVLEDTLLNRYGIGVSFGAPEVIYRETIARAAAGFVDYTMPKPCWAVMKFWIEPLPRGSGVVFESVVPVKDVMRRYQNQVRQALPIALKQGMYGWPVTDVKITLVEGNHHLIHTHPLDFIVATPMGIMDGLRRGGTTLLEPLIEARIAAPRQYAGRILSDISQMRGSVSQQTIMDGLAHILCELPVKDSMDYPIRLAAATGGRGSMSIKLKGYRDCPLELGATTPRRDVNPLDTAKYILAARSALEGGIFDIT
ncbi:MAG: GTP-binding protein [Christensenellales bacterium]|jgi:ribosomal protection tetracycline resistance protein